MVTVGWVKGVSIVELITVIRLHDLLQVLLVFTDLGSLESSLLIGVDRGVRLGVGRAVWWLHECNRSHMACLHLFEVTIDVLVKLHVELVAGVLGVQLFYHLLVDVSVDRFGFWSLTLTFSKTEKCLIRKDLGHGCGRVVDGVGVLFLQFLIH